MKSPAALLARTCLSIPVGRASAQVSIDAVTVGVHSEFDAEGMKSGGITDVRINAGVESKTSSTIAQTDAGHSQSAVKAGANSTWSWNSGVSGEVSGGFDSSVF